MYMYIAVIEQLRLHYLNVHPPTTVSKHLTYIAEVEPTRRYTYNDIVYARQITSKDLYYCDE